jgi:hypothetical protein
MAAQKKIEEEVEDQELQLATEAVARLMIPGRAQKTSAELQELEAKVAAAKDIHLGLDATDDADADADANKETKQS